MSTLRSAIITLALALLLWPLAVHAAPLPVSGTVTVNPPLTVTAQSQARFYFAQADAPQRGDFGTRIGNPQQVFGQTINFNLTIPDGSFRVPGARYRLYVYIVNGTGQSRAGWIDVTPSSGTQLNFIAGSYTGSLPPDSAGTVALLIGVILGAVAMIFLLARQLRLRALARPSAA